MCVALAMREYRACGSPGDRCAQLRGKQFRCEVELEVGSTELRDGLNEMRWALYAKTPFYTHSTINETAGDKRWKWRSVAKI